MKVVPWAEVGTWTPDSYNIAQFGAGLYFYTKINNVTIHDSEIVGNEVSYGGGGLYLYSPCDNIDTSHTVVSFNSAQFGAGLFLLTHNHNATLRHCIISYNTAEYNGGGVQLDDHNEHSSCYNGTFLNNICGFSGGTVASLEGGGIYKNGYNNNCILRNSIIASNTASFGGGISSNQNNVITVLVSGQKLSNIASYDGGGIFAQNHNTDMVITHSIISYNSAVNNGGGIYLNRINSNIRLESTIVSRNSDKNGGSLYRDNVFILSSVISDNIVGIDNGTITRTGGSGGGIFAYYNNDNISIIHSILSHNMAVTNGEALYLLASNKMLTVMYCSIVNNIAVNGEGVALLEQNTHARIQYSNFTNNKATSGAALYSFDHNDHFILFHSLVMGNTGATQGAVAFSQSHNFSVTYCSFGRNNATMGLGGAVVLVNGISGVISDTSLSFNSAANGGAISLDSCQNILFSYCTVLNNVAISSAGGLYLSSSNTDIVSRYCEFSSNSGADGGAMHLADGNHRLFLTNTVFMSNTATLSGGAISIQKNSNVFQVSSSVFIGNSASNGGGIAFGDMIRNVAVRHVVFENNIANWVTNSDGLGSGGAVFAASSNEISVSESRFSANVADRGGGAIALFTNHRYFLITNCVFHSNVVTAGRTALGTITNTAGAVAVIGTGNSDVNISGCTFRMNQNRIGRGGALSLIGASNVFIAQSTFLKNSAGLFGEVWKYEMLSISALIHAPLPVTMLFPSQMMLQVPSMLVVNDTFRSNSAGNRGTVYWESHLMRELQGLSSSTNKWTGNVAKYGSRYASDLCRISSPSNITAYRYPENNILPTVTAIPFLNSGAISATVDSIGYKCGGALSTGATLVGSTDAVLKDGKAEFLGLVGSCYPGGYFNLYFSETTLANKAMTTVSFPECLIGDKLSTTGKQSLPLGTERCQGNNIKVIPGYWRILTESYSTIQCPYSPSCLGGNRAGTESCDEGYKGPFCMTCGDGYYISDVSGKCSVCTGSATALSIASVDWLFGMSKKNPDCCGVIQSIVAVTVSLPLSITRFLDSFSWIDSGFLVKLLAVSCSKYRSDHVAQLTYLTVTPIVFTVDIRVHFMYIFLLGLNLILPGVSRLIAESYFCRDIDLDRSTGSPVYVLRVDPSISCSSDRYTEGVVWAFIMMIVYPIGVPLVYFILYRYRMKIRAEPRRMLKAGGGSSSLSKRSAKFESILALGFLYNDYEKKHWYWEVIETIRKLALTAGLSVISHQVGVKLVYGMTVSIAFVKIYGYYRPFESDDTDNLQELVRSKSSSLSLASSSSSSSSLHQPTLSARSIKDSLPEDIYSKQQDFARLVKNEKDQRRVRKELVVENFSTFDLQAFMVTQITRNFP
eukprot:gene6026-12146_t